MSRPREDARRGGLTTFKLTLVVVILLLIPTTMEQLSMHEETVRTVGRVCIGIALLFFLRGLASRALRLAALLLLGLIVAAALISEGVIEAPHLLTR